MSLEELVHVVRITHFSDTGVRENLIGPTASADLALQLRDCSPTTTLCEMILNYVFILAAVTSQRLQDELLLSARHTVFLVTVLADSQFIHVCHLGLGSAVATFELGLLVESDFNGTSGDLIR